MQRWLDAGLVVFGKTNTPEFGAKGITESHLFGPARNPWNLDHTPGRLLRRRGRGGGRRDRAVRCGQRRRRLDPDPGLGVRAVRAQALPRAGALRARWSRRGWAGPRPTAWSRARCATRRRCSTCSSAPPPTRRTSPPCPRRRTPTRWARTPARCASGCAPTSTINPTPHAEAVAAATGAGQLLESLGHHVEELTRPAVRRRRPGPRLPHHLVRLRRGLGRAGQGVQRLRRQRLRARHPGHGRPGPGHQAGRPGPGDRGPPAPRPPARGVPRLLRPAADPQHRAAPAARRRPRPPAVDAEGPAGAGAGPRGRAAAVHARSSSS